MANTQVELVTPTRTLFSGEAEMVVCRTAGGEIAFLADHMPYLGLLEPGVVRVVGASSTDSASSGSGAGAASLSGENLRMAVHSGVVEVKDNHVIMLADVAELADEIDVERARRAESDAGSKASSGEDPEAEAALRRAQVRLEVASGS